MQWPAIHQMSSSRFTFRPEEERDSPALYPGVARRKRVLPALVWFSIVVVYLSGGGPAASAEETKDGDPDDRKKNASAKEGDAPQPVLDPVAAKLNARPVYTHAIKTLRFRPDGKYLAAGRGNGQVDFFLVEDGKRTRTLNAHQTWVFNLAFSPDGKSLATGGGDSRIRVWDMQDGEMRHDITGHDDDLHGVAYLPDGRTLVSGSDDRTVRIWNIATKEPRILSGHEKQVTAVDVSPDGATIASASRDATVRLWETSSGKELSVWREHEKDVLDVDFSPDGKSLASASYDKTVRLWDISTGKTVHILKGHKDRVFTVEFSPDGKLLASGGRDDTLRIWKSDDGALVQTLDFSADVSSVVFSPYGNLLAVATSAGELQLLKFHDIELKPLHTLLAPPAKPESKETSQRSAKELQHFLDLHQLAADPNNESWLVTVAELADLGNEFTADRLRALESANLSTTQSEMLQVALKSIDSRANTAVEENQIASRIVIDLERAVMADLNCHSLETTLVSWTMKNLRTKADSSAVRAELERLRDNYVPQQDVATRFGSFQERVRAYAAKLLEPRETDELPTSP